MSRPLFSTTSVLVSAARAYLIFVLDIRSCDTQDLIEIRTTPIRDRQREVRVPLRGLRKLGCANFGRGAPKRGERRAVSSEDFVSSDRGVLGASLFDYDVNLIVDYVTNI